MIPDIVRRLPRPLRAPLRVAGVHTGKHRGPRFQEQAATQLFVRCGQCGGVESAATVNGDVVRCAEGHRQPAGGAA